MPWYQSCLLVRLLHRLLGGQDFDEAAAEIVEAVRAADVAVQAHRLELREHVDLVDLAVDAVRERDVDQPILAGQRHGRLGAVGRQRQQPRAAPAAQNYRHDVFHGSCLQQLQPQMNANANCK